MKYRVVKYDAPLYTFYKIEQGLWGFWTTWADSRVNYFTKRQDAIDKVLELRKDAAPHSTTKTILDV
jgi:hypothetical protein